MGSAAGVAQCPYFSKKRATMTIASATTTTSSITTARVARVPSPSLDYFGNWVIAPAPPTATPLNFHKRFTSGFLQTAVSDTPRPTPEIYLLLTTGRVRYSTSVSGLSSRQGTRRSCWLVPKISV